METVCLSSRLAILSSVAAICRFRLLARMRRQIGEAIHDLQQAEQLTPELTHAHHGARLVTRDLLQLSGLRPRPEIRDLAERFGVLP